MFRKYENKELIKESFRNIKPLFCSVSDRAYWNKIKDGIYETLLKKEAKIRNQPLAHISATLYMEYERSGNRSAYEDEYLKRRYALSVYTILECIENSGAYMDKIIDILWLILEETTWCAPAHNNLLSSSDALPGFDGYAIDHYSAETGALLSFVYTAVGERLDSISKNIKPRIVKELRARITDNYLERDDYWWMGFSGARVNNWNPWVNSNVLAVLPVSARDSDEAAELILKIMKSLDYYIDKYPYDGGCDEGPVYWQQSAVTFMECLYAIYEYSGGKINELLNEKVINMFHYMLTAYIGGGRVITFSDSASTFNIEYGVIYKLAKIMNDKAMLAFSKDVSEALKNDDMINYAMVMRVLDRAAANSEMKKLYIEKNTAKCGYIESIQIMTHKLGSGLYIAAKGGHNAESHNHNDVGSFMIYKNNVPFIVDSGKPVYTRDSFGDKRYTIWTNVSEYHNLPTIGGYSQNNGKEYAAENVKYSGNKFSLDIGRAYENRQDIEAWRREFDFTSENSIKITDEFQLKRAEEICFNLLSAVSPKQCECGLLFSNENEMLSLSFETDIFDFEVEEIVLEDENLKASWGESLFRIRLKTKGKLKCGAVQMCFK